MPDSKQLELANYSKSRAPEKIVSFCKRKWLAECEKCVKLCISCEIYLFFPFRRMVIIFRYSNHVNFTTIPVSCLRSFGRVKGPIFIEARNILMLLLDWDCSKMASQVSYPIY